jgi:hypothetical protein
VIQLAGIPDFGEQGYVGSMIDEDSIQDRWDMLGCKLDERGRRLFAAAEVHCRAGEPSTCHLRRYEEKGAGRQLQERRIGLASEKLAEPRQRA